MSSPDGHATSGLKRVLQYLKGTVDVRIRYERCRQSEDNALPECVHSDFAGGRDEDFSTTGYIFYLAGEPID